MVKAMRTQAVTSVSRLLPEESGHVAALPGCLDGMGVVVLPDVLDGVQGGARVEQNEASQRRACSPSPSAAGNLYAVAVQAVPCLSKRVIRIVAISRQAKVSPLQPPRLPRNGRRCSP